VKVEHQLFGEGMNAKENMNANKIYVRMTHNGTLVAPEATPVKKLPKDKRVQSIDLLRGVVMIIMAIDHVRDFFHKDAFLYSPTDLAQTNVPLFFTRFITHYCAPVFVFLAGISAYLYGAKKSREELAFFLFTRGLWLVFAEMFIITLTTTFNPTYPFFNLQVIWAIGISMIILSALVHLNLRVILWLGIVCIAAHNLLDGFHVPGTGAGSVFWSFLHEPGDFRIGPFTFLIRYPVLPWIGIIAVGYYFGHFYSPAYNETDRKKMFLLVGIASVLLFLFFRSANLYGDAAHWSVQGSVVFSLLSFLNVTKYPPSLLYALMTLGPALIFLAVAERPLNRLTEKISVFGRVPMFYYILHLFFIHLFAVAGAALSGYHASDMVLLTHRVNSVPALKGYGFSLPVVYLVWAGLILLLYPLCKWFDRYKRANVQRRKWLSYL
jgi:uncharacterized membrane protein